MKGSLPTPLVRAGGLIAGLALISAATVVHAQGHALSTYGAGLETGWRRGPARSLRIML